MTRKNKHSDSSPRGFRPPKTGEPKGVKRPLSQVGAITAIVLLACGIIMSFIALMLPPPGEIHDSVLYIFAQILIYCGSIFGIDSYINHKIKGRPSPPDPSPVEGEGSR